MSLDQLTDQEIVEAILNMDDRITKRYLYQKCYPLFYSIFNKYYTDSESVFEFISEIYLFIMTPKEDSGRCKLAEFGYRCSLTMWLKIVAENYCRQLFCRRGCHEKKNEEVGDRNCGVDQSLDMSFQSINSEDVHKLLMLMTNERYRAIIRYRYLEERTNEETAELLSMSMDNYYNKHRLAKAQFCTVLRKEGLL